MAMASAATLRFYRRNLPHWVVADGTFFVTIRQAGTLPRHVIVELQAERQRLLDANTPEQDYLDTLRKQFIRIERILDACGPSEVQPVAATGSHFYHGILTTPKVADILLDSLARLEDEAHGWDIHAAVVMSNHAHLLLHNRNGRSNALLDPKQARDWERIEILS
jgi:hypothetical protein